MKDFHAGFSKNRKGQMKIQQMAFVLMAIVIFFALVSLFYFSIRIRSLQKSALSLREEEAKELIRKLAVTPEFSFEDCTNCIDLDKVMILKERQTYKGFWDLDVLFIETVYPDKEGECTLANYPECRRIMIINKTEEFGITSGAFVSLCRWDQEGYYKCELGKVYASGRGIE
jgi:hypothetical protein